MHPPRWMSLHALVIWGALAAYAVALSFIYVTTAIARQILRMLPNQPFTIFRRSEQVLRRRQGLLPPGKS